ncbi:MAG: Phosphate transport system permease protein PstA [Myxococcaceae bacterium]|nr:Phosphate transport system permease protein PstA [Myxococcaceae bacterium]
MTAVASEGHPAVDTRAPRLRRGMRKGRWIEEVLGRVLAVLSVSIALIYAGGLAYLVARGGSRLVAFTTFATPLSDVDGEDVMRIVLAAGMFAGMAWAGSLVVRGVLARVNGGHSRKVDRVSQGVIALAGIVGAVAFRDHLPRFLIGLPSETRAGGGIGPEIFNTLYFAVLSTLVTLPVGVGAALYMARFAKQPRFVASLRTALDTLASLPSIVYGLFGFLVFVVQMKLGYSLFAGAIVLAILNLPLVVGVTEESLRAVPRELEEASLALGATPVQTALRITIPYAWPGILSALVLSIGRVFAESAPLIMTAGTTISRGTAYSLDPFRGGETLAVHLWYVNSAGLAPDRADVSAGTAAALVVLILLTNVLAARLARFGGAAGTRIRRATR